TILEVNPAGAALAGVKDPAALRGINIGELLPPRELESARQYLRDLLHDRPIVEPFEIHLEPASSDRRFLHVRSRVIREEGTDPYVQVVARDVTPEKESQWRLLESERQASMGQVAAFVAHEINTPLTNISLLSANLARAAKDPAVLEQLVKIAFQATGTASVTVRLQSENDHITIAVLDTGSGIDPEMRARLFQPFVTTKPRSEGLGLGLVFVKQVVEGHDGSIQVISEPG